jgi:hypothetical protein
MVHPTPNPQVLRSEATARAESSNAQLWTAIGVLVALVTALVIVTLQSGNRRRWAPARQSVPSQAAPRDETPDQIFLLQPPPSEL